MLLFSFFSTAPSTALIVGLCPHSSLSTHHQTLCESGNTKEKKKITKKQQTPTQAGRGRMEQITTEITTALPQSLHLWNCDSFAPQSFFWKIFSNFAELFLHKESSNRVEPEKVETRRKIHLCNLQPGNRRDVDNSTKPFKRQHLFHRIWKTWAVLSGANSAGHRLTRIQLNPKWKIKQNYFRHGIFNVSTG